MRWSRLGWLAAFSLIAGCQRSEPRTTEERGASVYMRSCSGCHGPDGRGAARMGLSSAPRDLTDPSLYEDPDALRETILRGQGQMPAFRKVLVGQDLDDLMAFLVTLPRR
ncbi:MAG: cytochrome c [Polyangiaceae bacterium]|nr:cytochrome c [Polyangiaceae bacterium]